jgi:8-oxo-dGTP pyrophosphatase MutT (NUDIX family)
MAWVTHDSETKYTNRWIHVREDRVTGPGGDGIYGVVTMQHPAVFVVALDDEDRVCLVTLDRYTTGVSIEVPAGGSDGDAPLVAAQRELREETGFEAADWTEIGRMHALNGIADASEHVFLARGVRRATSAAESAETQGEEGIESVRWVAFADVLRMIADGEITDGETIAAIAYAGIQLGRFA